MASNQSDLTCTLYYDYHHSADWREEWSDISGTLVREQKSIDGKLIMIDHQAKTLSASEHDELIENHYSKYQIIIDPNVSEQFLYSIRTCDCKGCNIIE